MKTLLLFAAFAAASVVFALNCESKNDTAIKLSLLLMCAVVVFALSEAYWSVKFRKSQKTGK